jgi:pimeloyl-ACP methyl ester carboxylesterase
VVVPNAGHMSFVEDRARYLDAVRAFLEATKGS